MREGKNCLLSSIPATLDTSSIPGLSSDMVAELDGGIKRKGGRIWPKQGYNRNPAVWPYSGGVEEGVGLSQWQAVTPLAPGV